MAPSTSPQPDDRCVLIFGLQRYIYRLPRAVAAFPVDLLLEDQVIRGRCCNLSATGMGVTLSRPVPRGQFGTVRITGRETCLELRVSVTNSAGLEAGLRFHFQSETERQMVRALLRAISG